MQRQAGGMQCRLPARVRVGEAPRWAYLLSAISVIAYVNLDSLDGKQARRTGSSSPLGQLFDHGCDALTVHLLLANISCSMQFSCGWQNSAGVLAVRPRMSMHCWTSVCSACRSAFETNRMCGKLRYFHCRTPV
jgi:phosphatidylglycerophosphate synthase